MKKIIILIPAYNEAENIENIINRIPEEILGIKVSILVVNDGSVDETKKMAHKREGVVVVSHLINQGVGKAFQTGLQKALEMGADYMVNIDADGQYTPQDIERIIRPVLNGEAEFVVANRFRDEFGRPRIPENMSMDKYWGNVLMSKLISFLAGKQFDDVSSGFRAYSKKAMLMLELTGKFTYTQESFIDLAAKGITMKSISVSIKYFKDRKSRVANNLIKYSFRTMKIIIKTFRDYQPFLFFIYLSIIPAAVSLISGVFLFTWFMYTGSFTPYKAVGFIFIYFSAITLTLWVMGFLADMFTRIRILQEKILFIEKSRMYDSK